MADVSVDAGISQSSARGCRALVYTTDLIGYMFFIDGDGVFGYCKTTDGGATWGAQVNVDGAVATTTAAFDVWFDKWTSPTDTGTLIHTWWFDTTNDIVRWRTLDTNGDTLGTVRTVFTGASAVAGRGSFVSGCKTQSGYLYCAYDIDAGAEKGLHRSTNGGSVWSASLDANFIEATLDTCKLYPAYGTGDGNDCWAIYYDASALAITLKLWDSSAGSATESATIGASHTDGITDQTGQFGYDAMVRWSDGHLILAKISLRDNASSTHQVFDITDTSTITTKTAITTNIDDHYYPQIFIEQGPNTLYVMYNGKRDGSETMDTATKVYYTKSTDGGTTWTAGDTAYMEGTAGVVQQLWTSQTTYPGSTRLAAVWRVAATLLTNKVNSVVFQTIKGANIASASRPPLFTGQYGPAFVFELRAFVAMGTTLFSQTEYGADPEDYWQYWVEGLWEFDRPIAAKFSNFVGGTISQVLIALSNYIFSTITGTITMKIRTGSYLGTVIATSTTTINANTLKTQIPTWTLFEFPATVLTAGGTYWFSLERSVTDFDNNPQWHWNDGDNIADYADVNDLGVEFADREPAMYVISATPPIAVGSAVNAPTVSGAVGGAQGVTGTTIAVGSSVNGPTLALVLGGAFIEPNLSDYSWLTRFPAIEPTQWENLAGVTNDYGTYLAQEFWVGGAETLSSIDLRAMYQGTPVDNVYVEIRSGGRDGSVIGTSAAIAATTAPHYPAASAFVTLTFATPVPLVPGTLYAWVAKRTGTGSLSNALAIMMDNTFLGHELPGRIDPAHFALVWAGSVPAWSEFWDGSSGFQYRLNYSPTVNVPTVTYAFSGATIAVGSAVTAPTVAPGAVTVVGATISSGSGVNAPTLRYAVTTAFIEPELQDHGWPTSVDALNQASITGLTTSTYLGQEFWIRQKENLTSIDIRLSRTGSPVDNVYVEVYADMRVGGPVIGTSPDVVASSLPLDPVSGDDSDYVNFTFSTVTLFPGFYAWVIKRDGAGSGANVVNVHMDGPSRLSAETGLVYDGALNDWVESTQAFQYRLHFATSIFIPTVAPGAVTVVGGTRPTTIQVFAPSTTAVARGATITSGSGVFAPRAAYALTAPTISTSSTVSAPTAAIAITTTAIAVGSQVFAATVVPGATTAVGATIPTTVQLFAVVVVRQGEFAATTIASTAQVFVPTVIIEWAITTGFISRSYEATILGDHPTVYWRLDETGATAVDEISGQTAAISGGVTSIAGPLLAGNAAMHFDGTGKIVPTTNFRLHAGSWSVEGWFKRAAVPGGGNDFESWWSNGHFTNGAFYLGVHAGGTAQGQWIGATPSFIDSGISGLTGAWHHMVVTYDGARWRLYIDGVLRTNDAVTAATEPWPPPQQPGCIAWEPNRNRFWTGDVDEVAVYPTTLTDGQVAAHYAAATSLVEEIQVFAPTIVPGPVLATGATIAAGSVVQAPTVAPGAVTIIGGTRSSTIQLFAPTLTPITTGATIPSTVQLIAPTVTPGPVTVVTGVLGSTTTLFTVTVEVEIIPILVGDIGPAAEVFAPVLIARLFPPLARAHARVGVRYLVTSADVTCMMKATSGVSVRYLGVGGTVTTPVQPVTATVAVRCLVESDEVSVNVLEAT